MVYPLFPGTSVPGHLRLAELLIHRRLQPGKAAEV